MGRCRCTRYLLPCQVPSRSGKRMPARKSSRRAPWTNPVHWWTLGTTLENRELAQELTMSTVTETRATIDGETFSRVAFTPEALELLRKLWTIHGPLMFHQSGGCCDGSSPMCYPAGEFRTG